MSFFIPPKDFIVYETEYWEGNHRISTCLPGYLMVGTKICDEMDFEKVPFEAKYHRGNNAE